MMGLGLAGGLQIFFECDIFAGLWKCGKAFCQIWQWSCDELGLRQRRYPHELSILRGNLIGCVDHMAGLTPSIIGLFWNDLIARRTARLMSSFKLDFNIQNSKHSIDCEGAISARSFDKDSCQVLGIF
jgi:hypothetical protein